ncbi:MAG TPA: hypothetical protein VIV11_02830 [Kofleriaceae bacterium]
MRCVTCGTENTPDSRFCGGCGARQPASGEQRLAPTAKIDDNAPYPQSSAAPTGARPAAKGPVSYAPPSIPPQSVVSTPPPGSVARAPSQPSPYAAGGPQTPVSKPPSQAPRPAPKPYVSSASGSIAVPPRRPMGLIVLVLLIDIGLAAGGGVLLSKGLADKEVKKAEPPPVEKKSELPAPAEAPTQAAAVEPAARVEPVAPAPAGAAAREAPKDSAKQREPSGAKSLVTTAKPTDKSSDKSGDKAATKPNDKPADKLATKPADKAATKPTDKPADKLGTKPGDTPADKLGTKPTDKPADKLADKPTDKPVTKPDAEPKRVDSVPTSPQDPYPDTAKEIDAEAAKSKAALAKCAADNPAQGAIQIAFQVRFDGHVVNAAAVENTTGDGELARCLVTVISTWRVSAHNGAAINLVRPFNYQ